MNSNESKHREQKAPTQKGQLGKVPKVIEKPMKVERPGLMASLDDLNRRFGRGTVRVALAVLPPAPGG